MAGFNQIRYTAASTPLVVTNLHSLASSATWIAGWTSASVSNLANLNLDYLVGGTFTTNAANRQAGFVYVMIIASLNDTPLWPTTATGVPGTEGAMSFTAVEQSNSAVRLLVPIPVLATASQVYAFPETSIASLFGGWCPTHWAAYVTQNASTTTTAGLAAAGSALYYTPVMAQFT